jgi:hypothetical protein
MWLEAQITGVKVIEEIYRSLQDGHQVVSTTSAAGRSERALNMTTFRVAHKSK